MAKNKTTSSSGVTIDLTKTGPQSYRTLQRLNSHSVDTDMILRGPSGTRAGLSEVGKVHYDRSPEFEDFGKSTYDSDLVNYDELSQYQDLRGERQSGIVQLGAGILKGALLAGTTFLDGTLGLLVGATQAAIEGDWSKLWDNEFSKAMQQISDASEKFLPNYYTHDQRTQPWYENIFSANFIGDKFIKNLGFSVGAIGSGVVFGNALMATKLPQLIGALTKSVRTAQLFKSSAGAVISAINEGRVEAINNTRDWQNLKLQELDDIWRQKIAEDYAPDMQALAAEYEAARKEYEATKGKVVKIGSGDNMKIMDQAMVKYQEKLAKLDSKRDALQKAQEEQFSKRKSDSTYNASVAKIAEDRAKMGNADLLMNIPILTLSNLVQFGRLYSRGFNTARRVTTAPKFSYAKAARLGVKGFVSEGAEEINQRAASTIAGNYYSTDVNNFHKAALGKEEQQEVLSWANAFKEGIEETYSDIDAWEEFFIGGLTGLVGIPLGQSVRGKDGKLRSPIKIEGGIFNELNDYRKAVKRSKEVNSYLDNRLVDPKFLGYVQGLARHIFYKNKKQQAVDRNDAFDFKNSDFGQLVGDIVMFDNAGRLGELESAIDAAFDTSDTNLAAIIEQTTSTQTVNGNEVRRGPFVDKNGEPLINTEEGKKEMIDSLTKQYEGIKRAIKNYRRTKNEIDTQTGGALTDDQLAEATWLSVQIDNWNERAEQMTPLAKKAIIDLRDRLESMQAIAGATAAMSANAEEAIENTGKKFDKYAMGTKRRETLEKLANMSDKKFQQVITNPENLEFVQALIDDINDFGSDIISHMDKQNVVTILNDLTKVGQGIRTYSEKLSEWLSDPSKIAEDQAKAEKEVKDKEREKAETSAAEAIASAKSVAELNKLAEEAEDQEAFQAALDKAEKEGNKVVKNHREINQYDTELKNTLNRMGVDEQTAADVMTLWNAQKEAAENLDQVSMTDTAAINNEFAFDEASGGDVEVSQRRFQNARYTLQSAMARVANGRAFKNRFSKTRKAPVETIRAKTTAKDGTVITKYGKRFGAKIGAGGLSIKKESVASTNNDEAIKTLGPDAKYEVTELREKDGKFTGKIKVSNNGLTVTANATFHGNPDNLIYFVDEPTTGQSGVATVPVTRGKGPVAVPATPIGDTSAGDVIKENKEANGGVKTQRDLDRSQRGKRRYYRPAIPELHIEGSKEGDFRPFYQVVAERESGVDFSEIYEYLRENGAFDYVNSAKLKPGDTLGFMIDPDFNDHTIFIVDTRNNQIVGSLDESDASVARYEGLTELLKRIRDEYKFSRPQQPQTGSTQSDTVGASPVALSYLLENGVGTIDSAGYFLHAVAAAFPAISNRIEQIRNGIDSELLGKNPKEFVSLGNEKNPGLKQIEDLVYEFYGDDGFKVLTELYKNSTGFIPAEGKKIEAEIEKLVPLKKAPKTPTSISSEVSVKDGVTTTKFNRHRSDGKIYTGGGLSIDSSKIAEDSIEDKEDLTDIQLIELREAGGKYAGTIRAKSKESGTYTIFEVKFTSDPTGSGAIASYEDALFITYTADGYTEVSSRKNQPWTKDIGDLRSQLSYGWGEYKGLSYYKKKSGSRGGDNITIWFRGSLSEEAKNRIGAIIDKTGTLVLNNKRQRDTWGNNLLQIINEAGGLISTQSPSSIKFFATPKTRVSRVMIGRIPLVEEERSLADIPGVLGGTAEPIFGIIKNGVLTTNGKIDSRKIITPLDVANKEGRLYLLIPNGAGTYSPAAVRVRHFNSAEFNLNDATVAQSSVGESILAAISSLAKVTSQSEVNAAFKALADEIYLGKGAPSEREVNITWFDAKEGSGIIISRKVKKADGTYEKVTINGRNQIKEEKTPIYFQSKKTSAVIDGVNMSYEQAKAAGKDLSVFGKPKSEEAIKKEITEALLKLNMPLQVSVNSINTPGYNQRIIGSNMLTSNLREAAVLSNWFTMDYFDSEGKLQSATNPPSAPKSSSSGGTNGGTVTGTKVNVGGTSYIVDLKNNVIVDEKTGQRRGFTAGDQLIIDMAWAQDLNGDRTESSIMTENKIVTPKGAVLDRTTGKYLTGAEAQNVKDKLAMRDRAAKIKLAEAKRVEADIMEAQKKVDKSRTTDTSYFIMEEDGEYHPYDRVHTRIGDNWVGERTSTTNSERALVAGSEVDTVIGNFVHTNGNINISKPEHLSDAAFSAIIDRLTAIKERMDQTGEKFVGDHIMVFHKYADGTRIAGEIDILTVDKEGNFKIYDVKTSRNSFEGADSYFDKASSKQKMTTKAYYTLQVSSYQNLFESQHKVQPSTLAIMPFMLEFTEDASGTWEVSNVTPQKGIKLEYNPSVPVPIEKAPKMPVGKSPIKNSTIFNNANETLITEDSQRRVIPENQFDDNSGEIGYYELDGKVYTGYIKSIGEITGVPLHITKVRDKGFGNKFNSNSAYIVVFPNGKAIEVLNMGIEDADSIDRVIRALEGNPDRIKSVAAEKTQLIGSSTPAAPTNAAAETNKKIEAANKAKSRRRRRLRAVTSEQATWNREKELKWLEKVLPQLSKEDRVKVIDGLIQVSEHGPKAWGMFSDGIVTLSDLAAIGTTYHEAFHVVFNLIMSEEERTALYEEARKLYGDKDTVSLEEDMAEGFREYVMTQDARGLGRKILDFFKNLFAKITHWNQVQPSLTSYYHMINQGKYKNAKFTGEETTRRRQEEATAEIKAIKERAINDGTFMLAPNGNPTNLTERQWLQVRTKAFKDWFGDWEKVVPNTESAKRLMSYITEISNRNNRFSKLAQLLLDNGNLPYNLKYFKIDNNRKDIEGVAAMWHSSANLIEILGNSVSQESIDKHLLHELIHYNTEQILQDYKNGKITDATKKEAIKNLYDIITYAKDFIYRDFQTNKDKYIEILRRQNSNLDSRLFYAFDNQGSVEIDEFVSEIFTNPGFQEVLNNIPYKKSGKTIWEKLKDAISSILGLNINKGSVLEEALKASSILLQNDNNVSKVVDENGEPLVVYHGTRSSFNIFNEDGTRFGNYFTSDRTYAENIAKLLGSDRVMEVFLNIKVLKESQIPLVKDNIDAIYWEDAFNNGQIPDGIKGHDLVTGEVDSNSKGIEYVVFDSANIKSATDNIGTFSTTNDDIRYRVASITTYHGTGAYKIDKFSTDFLFTGEGNTAYTSGFYFTGSEREANMYRIRAIASRLRNLIPAVGRFTASADSASVADMIDAINTYTHSLKLGNQLTKRDELFYERLMKFLSQDAKALSDFMDLVSRLTSMVADLEQAKYNYSKIKQEKGILGVIRRLINNTTKLRRKVTEKEAALAKGVYIKGKVVENEEMKHIQKIAEELSSKYESFVKLHEDTTTFFDNIDEAIQLSDKILHKVNGGKIYKVTIKQDGKFLDLDASPDKEISSVLDSLKSEIEHSVDYKRVFKHMWTTGVRNSVINNHGGIYSLIQDKRTDSENAAIINELYDSAETTMDKIRVLEALYSGTLKSGTAGNNVGISQAEITKLLKDRGGYIGATHHSGFSGATHTIMYTADKMHLESIENQLNEAGNTYFSSLDPEIQQELINKGWTELDFDSISQEERDNALECAGL